MQHNKAIRILSFFSAVVLIAVCFIPASVSAVDMNYLDYLSNVQVNGELNIVTVSLPASVFHLDIYNSLNLAQDCFSNVTEVNYSFMPGDQMSYTIQIEPCTKDYLYIGNIPLDTEVNLYMDISSYQYGMAPPEFETPPLPDWQMNIGRVDGNFYYYDWNHNRVTDYCNYDVDGGLWDPPDNYTTTVYLSGSLQSEKFDSQALKNAPYFRPSIIFEDVTFSDFADVTFQFSKYEIVFHINSLVLGGQYGEILDAINDKLVEQGKYIDPETGNVLTAPPVPTIPDYSPDMDDVNQEIEDWENQLNYDEFTFPDYGSVKFGIGDLIQDQPFNTYIGTFQILWKNKLLTSMFIVIFTVCLISYFFFGKKG